MNEKPQHQRLRELIAQLGISQRQAAKMLGISERQMRSYLADPQVSSTALTAPPMVELALIALNIEAIDASNSNI